MTGWTLVAAGACGLALASVASGAGTGGRAATTPPGFRASVTTIGPPLRARLTSWRPGCPVAVRRLRLLTLSHWGFDGRVRRGRLIVRADQARKVVRAFRAIFAAQAPIRRMRLVEAYGSSDRRSMAADNTSGFNCRPVEGSTSWSAHAYGLAIDVNPLENPYVKDGRVLPHGGTAYLDRSQDAEGMIHAGDAVVRAFRAVGWTWGGTWRSLKDYQHFSATGR